MGPFSVICQECQIRKIYFKFSVNALLLLARAALRIREMMFNSFHAVKHHMYEEQQTAEAEHVHVHVSNQRPNQPAVVMSWWQKKTKNNNKKDTFECSFSKLATHAPFA